MKGFARPRSPEKPKAARSMEISMSSEKRSMRWNTLESEVPPLKRSSGIPCNAKRCFKVQQTQKSFSTAVVVELRRLAASSK
jgi:hypothetical protein